MVADDRAWNIRTSASHRRVTRALAADRIAYTVKASGRWSAGHPLQPCQPRVLHWARTLVAPLAKIASLARPATALAADHPVPNYPLATRLRGWLGWLLVLGLLAWKLVAVRDVPRVGAVHAWRNMVAAFCTRISTNGSSTLPTWW
ncbi:MAG: hypothetical protein PSV22_04300 [Pseudolabrys sp.]|nr:hypothetical protein [Pseudolabrys sp.]